MQKMRVRRTPSIQAHVTNRVDHPLLLAADAASAVALGFRELETTVPLLRDAPLNAVALLVGGQVPAPGALTQCAVEERLELELGMRGLTTYAETVSVYGTEQVFVDGDDTPWSKAFLASCYASRGLKMRFTSGSGAECLMGATEGCSMLYLEARCLAVTRAAGSQGTQNGGIDGVNVAGSVPDGMREVIAENLLRDDARPRVLHRQRHADVVLGHPAHRAHAAAAAGRLRLPVLGLRLDPGLRQRLRALELQRRGHRRLPRRAARLGLRGRACARSPTPSCCRCAGARSRRCAPCSRSSTSRASATPTSRPCVQAHGSLDVPALDPHLVPDAADQLMQRGLTALDVVRALAAARLRGGGRARARDAAPAALRRLPADLGDLQRGHERALGAHRPERLRGPGHGLPHDAPRAAPRPAPCARSGRPRRSSPSRTRHAGCLRLRELGPARRGTRPDEVVVGLSPAFAHTIWLSLSGLTVAEVLRQVLAGHRGGGRVGAPRAGAPHDRRRRDRLDGLAARGLGHRHRAAGQGHGADPPRRPAAARQPRAVLDRAARDARALPRPRPQRRALRPQRRARAALPGRVERAARPELPRARRGARGARARQRRRGRPVEVEAAWPS